MEQQNARNCLSALADKQFIVSQPSAPFILRVTVGLLKQSIKYIQE